MDDVTRLKQEVWGNGQPGLAHTVRRIERDLYADDATGAPGLVADVYEWRKEDRRRWAELEGAANLLRWVGGIVGTAAGAVLIDVVRGWVGG